MSDSAVSAKSTASQNGTSDPEQAKQNVQHKNYRGFVAGVFSGIGKLSGEHVNFTSRSREALIPFSRPSVR